MRKQKASVAGRSVEKDPDAIPYDQVDWDDIQPETIDLDPELVERIRARRRLKPLTLRVGIEQIAEARRVAAETGLKYQAILRRWLAEGASKARQERMRSRTKKSRHG